MVSNCAWAVRIVPDELAADRMLALEHVAVSPRSHQLERIDLDRSHTSPILAVVSALADWSWPGEGDKEADKKLGSNCLPSLSIPPLVAARLFQPWKELKGGLTGRGELSPP